MKCVVIGPRGGIASADVTCDTCVCANKCVFSGPNTMPWGCFDWVDADGRRVVTTKAEAIEAAMPPDDYTTTQEDKEDTHEQGKE